MKIKENYKVREIAGENLIVEQGKSQSDMTKVISLNNTALLLWKELQGREFSLEDAAEILMNHYGISKDQALVDTQKWVEYRSRTLFRSSSGSNSPVNTVAAGPVM